MTSAHVGNNKHLMRGPEGNKIIITSFPRDESLRLCRNQPDSSSWRHERFSGNLYEWQRHGPGTSHSHPCDFVSSVGAARKVSPNWSQETMTCHSSNCFSVFFWVRKTHHWYLLFRAAATWPIFALGIWYVIFLSYLTWNIHRILLFFSHVVAYSLKGFNKTVN